MVERPRLGARACIGCLAKISKQARKLYSGSLVSASTWGHPASNVANSPTEALEKRGALSTGIREAGRCRTSVLLVVFRPRGHAVARLLKDFFREWFAMWREFVTLSEIAI